MGSDQVGFIENPKKFPGRVYEELLVERGQAGVKASDEPDEADVVDAGEVLQGVGVGGLGRVRRPD